VLEQQQFLRIHRQYIINLNEVKHFNRNESLLTMTTGDVLPVSRLQKDKLIEQYGWLCPLCKALHKCHYAKYLVM